MLAEAPWASMFHMPQIAIVMGCLTGMAAILGAFWYRIERVKSNNELKRSLVERGMPADEIERIMASGAEEEH